MGHHGEFEGLGALGREPMLKEVREHAHAERDEHVGEKGERRDADLAARGSHEVGVVGFFDRATEAPELVGDQDKGQNSHRHEDDRLEGIGPRGRPRSSRKNVTEHH